MKRRVLSAISKQVILSIMSDLWPFIFMEINAMSSDFCLRDDVFLALPVCFYLEILTF